MFVRHYELRRRLAPYLYTAAYTQSTTGLPLLRPLLLDHAFTHDRSTRAINDQYLLGDALMMAPAGMSADGNSTKADSLSRFVYFPGPPGAGPPAVWYQYWDQGWGATHAAPARVNVSTPVGFAPLYIRGGGVIPMLMSSAHPRSTHGEETVGGGGGSVGSSVGKGGQGAGGASAGAAAAAAVVGGLELVVALSHKESGTASGSIFLDDGVSIDTLCVPYAASPNAVRNDNEWVGHP